ncbi:GLPGLI family protein [Chryseobacterium aquaticum]|nr:GLPGLI family protein [Chryseobacterium aquaticum]
MFRYNFFSFFFFFWTISLHCQKIDSSYMECKYLVTFLIDTSNVNTLKQEYASLLIGKNATIFRSNQKAIADSISLAYIRKTMNSAGSNMPEINTGLLPSAKYQPEVLNRNGQITLYNAILEDLYSYPLNKNINWRIEKERKKIQGYTCTKVTCEYGNKSIIAWYTDEIPIPEGPYTFKGLPGLVLEAYDSKKYFHFILVGLVNVKKPIALPKVSIPTTYEKFYNKRKQLMDDPLGAFMNTFGRRAPKDNEERIIRNIKSINNFLD